MESIASGRDAAAGRAADAAEGPGPAADINAPPDRVPSQTALALADAVEGARAYRLWSLLSWQDIRRRYRRSKLGPFWLTISMGVLVGALGILYAGLFKVDVSDYLPFLAVGFITWSLISGLINEGCDTFISAETIIKQVNLPLSVHVYRTVCRNTIILGHNAVIYLVVIAVFQIWPGWTGLLALPGLALLCLNGVWMGLLFGMVSARFRDVPQIVASIVQLAFFLTPILWKPDLLPDRATILELNPFYHFVEVVRAPALGQSPAMSAWLAVIGTVVVGWAVTLVMYRRYRSRIAYWV